MPLPDSADMFWQLVEKGKELRNLHLMESVSISDIFTKYPVDGNSVVDKPKYDEHEKRVYINKEQYFEGVPEVSWEFYIGGYQPAQKWLKDRKGKALSYEDIIHYQKIIFVLNETHRIMKEIEGLKEF